MYVEESTLLMNMHVACEESLRGSSSKSRSKAMNEINSKISEDNTVSEIKSVYVENIDSQRTMNTAQSLYQELRWKDSVLSIVQQLLQNNE